MTDYSLPCQREAIPAAMRSSLIDPVKTGDPVFCSAVCRMLVREENLVLCMQVLSALHSCHSRLLHCELLFSLCKCSSHDCRLLVASILPVLLWVEWVLCHQCTSSGLVQDEEGAEDETSPLEEDLAAVRIALLAAYHQDYHISPLTPVTRSVPFYSPSIYRDGVAEPQNYNSEVFPFNVEASNESAPSPHNEPLDRFDDHTRAAISCRLCQFFQDYSPLVPDLSLILYSVLIIRLSTVGTKLESQDLRHRISAGTLLSNSRRLAQRNRTSADRRSDLALGFAAPSFSPPTETISEGGGHCHDGGEASRLVETVFYPGTLLRMKRRYPIRERLALLWAEVLTVIGSHYPGLEDHVRQALISRVRINCFPTAILALDR